jgi:cytoskeletal protein RodZ
MKIPASRLQDLETGDYSQFGGLTYVRLFLKSYSRRLGVDVADALTELESPLPGDKDYRPYLAQKLPPWTAANAAGPGTQAPKGSGPGLGLGWGLKATALVCAAILTAGTIYWVSRSAAEKDSPASTPPPAASAPATEIRRADDNGGAQAGTPRSGQPAATEASAEGDGSVTKAVLVN